MAVAWIDCRKALECLTLLKIDERMRKSLQESIKNWKVNLECGTTSLGEVLIYRGIFQRDSLSPLLFVMALKSLTNILRKSTAAYQFAKNGEKINHFLFMDDLKLYAKRESIGFPCTDSESI